MINCSEEILENDNIVVQPYNVNKILDNNQCSYYGFITEDNDNYVIIFNKILNQNVYSVNFKLNGSSDNTQVVNKGRFFKVMSTVSSTILDFLSSKKPDCLSFQATENFDGDLRRYNVYKRYVLSLIVTEYILEEDLEKRTLTIKKKY